MARDRVVRIESPVRYQEPEFLPWDARRVPMTFVGGYLGAGKTTIINELLANATCRIAVIVNDMGSINVDARLIRRSSTDMIEVSNGCVCCSSLDGMGAALDVLRTRPEPPDQVVVELSGVADPDRMVPWARSAGFTLDGLVVVVAADQLTDQSIPQAVIAKIRTHITSADTLILTKTDLVEPQRQAEVSEQLTFLAPGTTVVDAAQSRLLPGSLGRLLALGGRRSGAGSASRDWHAGAGNRPPVPQPPTAPTLFDLHETLLLPVPSHIDVAELHRWLEALIETEGPRLIRAKAIVDSTDWGLVIAQVVGRRVTIERVPGPETEPTTDLVVIRLAS
jgi:G3E family GTPase